MRWLYCVAAYLGWQLGGAALLIIAKTILLAASLYLLVSPIRDEAFSPEGLLVLGLGVFCAAERFVVRPEIVTFLMVSVYLVMAEQRCRGRKSKVPLWILVIAQVVWVNSHTLFVLGPLILWLFVIGEASKAKFDRGMILVALLTSAACWINPYGHAGAMFPFTLLGEIRKGSALSETISEFRSPLKFWPWGWELWCGAVLAVVSAATFLLNWKRRDPARLLLWIAFLYLACTARRNVALFAFVAIWAALRNLDELRKARTNRGSEKLNHGLRGALALGFIAAAWYVETNRMFVARDGVQECGLGIAEQNTPTMATEFLLTSEARPNLFHSMADGAYLIWAAHDRYPVLVDGRLEVYGEEFLGNFFAAPTKNWDGLADEYCVNVLMIGRGHLAPLLPKVLSSKRWVLVHVDALRLVFVRDIPEHVALIRKFRVDLNKPWVARGPEPDETPATWRQTIGGVSRPWYSLGMVENFLMLGSAINAEAYLERGMKQFPDSQKARLSRGVAGLFLRDGRPADAIECLKKAVRLVPQRAELHAALAEIFYRQGNFAIAAAGFGEAVKLSPKDVGLRMALGAACVRSGKPDAAAEAYREALRIDPKLEAAKAALSRLEGRAGDPVQSGNKGG